MVARVCRPSIATQGGVLCEFVAEDVLQYLTPSALVDRVEDVLVSHERPGPVLVAIDRKAGFIAVDDVAFPNAVFHLLVSGSQLVCDPLGHVVDRCR